MTSPPEPLVQIQNNFTETFIMMPSNKIVQMVLLLYVGLPAETTIVMYVEMAV